MSMRKLDVDCESFCEECPLEQLTIDESKLYCNNHMVVVERVARCEHLDLCRQLWNHLLDCDEDIDDDEDDCPPDDDNPDWTFSKSASYEDRQM